MRFMVNSNCCQLLCASPNLKRGCIRIKNWVSLHEKMACCKLSVYSRPFIGFMQFYSTNWQTTKAA